MTELHAPFPWFGGKRRCAEVVWRAFGADVNNYVEPFFGSGAVLLGRPGGAGKIETANDLGRYVVNFWRAVTIDPEAVAEWADWPVNEADLHARHVWLVEQGPELRKKMHHDPYFYDVQIAGWWVWGICQWIGGGWCAEPDADNARVISKKVPKLDGIGKGVHSQAGHPSEQLPKLSVFDGAEAVGGVHAQRLWQKRPRLTNPGTGINGALHQKRPVMGGTNAGRGIHSSARRPQMTSAGQGVHLPSLGNDRGLHGVAAAPCVEWFRDLQHRLRRVRFACGDWKRVLGPSVLGKGKNVGGRRPCAVFLDPPYSQEMRDKGLYADDAAGISDEVRQWALEHGDDPDLRIALCGYAGEHEMPGWTEHAWKAGRGYAGDDNENRQLERIWFSPHCLPIDVQPQLFAGFG